jgi:succinate dehydrogenase / fumarate reductase cytochrome b subunit
MANTSTGLFGSSLVRKFWMALTGLFLITFLVVHLIINLLTLSSDPELFNAGSHFMATNPLIQVMQYVLAAGFIMHIATGIYLTRQNHAARPVKYYSNNESANSGFTSRSMIISGMLVLVFLVLHLRDYFWVMKFGDMTPYESDYHLVVGLFSSALYTLIYVVAFIFLGMHLHHGFQSAFQSLGARHPKYLPLVEKFGFWYSILVPGGFALIAIFHFVNNLN